MSVHPVRVRMPELVSIWLGDLHAYALLDTRELCAKLTSANAHLIRVKMVEHAMKIRLVSIRVRV